MTRALSYEASDGVAVLRLDDGKANALGPAVFDALHGGLDRAEKEEAAVVLAGRPGRFSAGFDLGVMREAGSDAARRLVTSGAEFAVRLARHPAPVVAACTGHALAMGAVLLLAADVRIGTRGDFKLGFNEVAIGMTTPLFLLEFARERLSKRHLQRGTVQAEIYAPYDAVDAGILDRVVEGEQLLAEARAEAARLAGLPRAAYARTKKRVWAGTLGRIEETLHDDMAGAFPG